MFDSLFEANGFTSLTTNFVDGIFDVFDGDGEVSKTFEASQEEISTPNQVAVTGSEVVTTAGVELDPLNIEFTPEAGPRTVALGSLAASVSTEFAPTPPEAPIDALDTLIPIAINSGSSTTPISV